ncbi:MAG: D-alanyl-D-alanine carboxypeptidase [Sphingomonas sp.]|jgi:D-alanyl-D-alanine carboxypeptidase|nr:MULTISPECIES: D-alanyl-D-alanine carboxypeptidase family protein [Sphingomonas]MCI4655577.1 D-alanyl-D-alanine carboxypeptidase [Sphingomonas aquatilis]ATI55331.1 D-alanyl-D-alanine carboxypeptidase [Sphingomonas melonis]MBI0531476.1 D-alanyl-D-alanine carboxypeptidase [Sphingomonas sp. TX0522]MBX8843789.1 D-alanyl-D-alanine carboxypeptidase [Sphingomonas melonis]MBX8853411.1 D-alanyl-D-alanine carboxypeptidase [Sphingomonas melonis]
MTRMPNRRALHRWGVALALTGLVGGSVPALAAPRPVSEIVMDARDGSVLYAENAGIVRRPASLTKMMTLLLTFDAIDDGKLDPSGSILISRYAASQRPSRVGFKPGARMGVEDAIRAVAVLSANDVAVALAEAVGGTEDRFARMMTERARALGMTDTSFTNATGLPGANLSTAEDMAKLSLALLREHPKRYAVFSTRSFSWAGRRVQNHNHLLGAFEGADGIKTGYTAEAGFALAASAKRAGRRLIAVVIGERSIQARDRRVERLLDQGFAEIADARKGGAKG